MAKKSYAHAMQYAVKDVLSDEFLTYFPELVGEYIPQSIVDAFVAALIYLFGDKFLRSNDRQQTMSRILTIIVPNDVLRHKIAKGLEEVIEEAVARQNEFGDDSEANKVIAREILARRLGVANQNQTSRDQGSRPQTPPPPSEKTTLQVVGELDDDHQKQFWKIVEGMREDAENAFRAGDPGPQKAYDEFMKRLNRVRMTEDEIFAILNATDGVKKTALQDLILQAHLAGGFTGGLKRVMDKTAGIFENLAGNVAAGAPGLDKSWDDLNQKLEDWIARRKSIR